MIRINHAIGMNITVNNYLFNDEKNKEISFVYLRSIIHFQMMFIILDNIGGDAQVLVKIGNLFMVMLNVL